MSDSKQLKYYVIKLHPPRANFPATITDDEKKIMGEHKAHWNEYVKKGVVVIFGPVAEKDSNYGLAIVETDNAELPEQIVKADPAVIKSTAFTYSISPMLGVGFVRK